jgi:hypothetical protein
MAGFCSGFDKLGGNEINWLGCFPRIGGGRFLHCLTPRPAEAGRVDDKTATSKIAIFELLIQVG